jgi:hypothetical protein
LVFDAHNAVSVLYGGSDLATGDFHSDTWTWDGSKWEQQHPVKEPVSRKPAAAAYDQIRGQVVVFGGEGAGGSVLSDTWTWSGQDWSQPATEHPPVGRVDAAAAFDRSRKVLVLFGGFRSIDFNASRPTNETWSWNGSAWALQNPDSSPPPRGSPVMAYDEARGQVVMFGGLSGNTQDSQTYRADTWTWNGTTWRQQQPAIAPIGRERAVMVYDSARKRTVLFGGQGDKGILNDTWIWDGKTWAQQHPQLSPPAECCDAATYDSARGLVVLFNGEGQIWTWDGTTWTRH